MFCGTTFVIGHFAKGRFVKRGFVGVPASPHCCRHAGEYTDKKENKIFLIYKEIQKRLVAKSYLTNGLLIYD